MRGCHRSTYRRYSRTVGRRRHCRRRRSSPREPQGARRVLSRRQAKAKALWIFFFVFLLIKSNPVMNSQARSTTRTAHIYIYVENPQPYQGKQTNKGTLPLICSSFGTSVRKFAPLLIFLCLNLGRLKCRSRWSRVQHLTCKRLPLLLVNCQLTSIDDGIDTRLSL